MPALVLYVSESDRRTARVGFVVSKAVGNAVMRNRVKRKLRHLMVPVLAAAPVSLDYVIRALPRAATSNLSETLDSALESCYEQLERKRSKLSKYKLDNASSFRRVRTSGKEQQ